MKRSVLGVTVFLLAGVVFGQVATSNISDYFPVSVGNTWTYANSAGKTTEIRMLKNSMPDPNANDGSSLYLVETQFLGIGTSSTMYSIKSNKVVVLTTKNILGSYHQNKSPFPVELAPAGQQWRQDQDESEYYLFKTTKSSIEYDDKVFTDCILVEQQIFTGGSLYMVKKSYYAKDIGLVYVTLQLSGERKSVYQKLVDCNFFDIENSKPQDEISEHISNFSYTTTFFFSKLAEVGLENIEKREVELTNDVQKTIFTFLCESVKNNLSFLIDAILANAVNLNTYINSPISDNLIIISLGNKPTAAALDKAIKNIVLANVFFMFKDQLKNSVQNQQLLGGTQEAEPFLSTFYKVDNFLNDDEYKNIMEPLYKVCIGSYLRHNGK